MITREEIISDIESVRRLLKYHEEQLALHDRHFANDSATSGRFFGVRPRKAFFLVLKETDCPMPFEELLHAFVAADGIRGQKRGIANPRESLRTLIENGKLKEVGDLIGLPEWADDKWQ